MDFGFKSFTSPEAESKIRNLKPEMQLRDRLEVLIDEMLEGQILLDEARTEFEKLYIQKAMERYGNHLSKTANALGVHRNTLSKKVSSFQTPIKNENRRLITRRPR